LTKLFKTPRFFAWLFPRRTWGFSRSSRKVYLTFDDGPDPDITPWILDYLAENDTKATFFCVGNNIIRHPELFQRILSEGHAVGNHTMHHEKGTETPFRKYQQSIAATQELVNNTLFRPPYGRIRAWQSFLLARKYKIVMWSWLSYDYDESVSTATILEKARRQIGSGDILVLHDNQKVKERVKILLPRIIEIVEEKGCQFSVIPE
jgi:peptidoglycan-N-acetylglucosamine deacetylase